MATSSSRRRPWYRARRRSSLALRMTALRDGAALVTVIPRPRRNSTSPSSRRSRNARRTVFALTPSTVARSRAGGRRSPGLASPSANARRIWAATCSWSGATSPESTGSIMLYTLAPWFWRRCPILVSGVASQRLGLRRPRRSSTKPDVSVGGGSGEHVASWASSSCSRSGQCSQLRSAGPVKGRTRVPRSLVDRRKASLPRRKQLQRELESLDAAPQRSISPTSNTAGLQRAEG
jgi:hypothetical protein